MLNLKDNHEYGGTGGKAPRIPNIGTRRRCRVFAFIEIYGSHYLDYPDNHRLVCDAV
jgi:hypothetical protein